MRTTVPLLLVALLCLDGAWALRCHKCTAQGETCWGPVQCPSHMNACVHVETSATGQHNTKKTAVQKWCVPSCFHTTPDPDISPKDVADLMKDPGLLDYRLTQRCCTTDLCNAAPCRGLGAATVGMVLLAPVLAALLGGFL